MQDNLCKEMNNHQGVTLKQSILKKFERCLPGKSSSCEEHAWETIESSYQKQFISISEMKSPCF